MRTQTQCMGQFGLSKLALLAERTQFIAKQAHRLPRGEPLDGERKTS